MIISATVWASQAVSTHHVAQSNPKQTQQVKKSASQPGNDQTSAVASATTTNSEGASTPAGNNKNATATSSQPASSSKISATKPKYDTSTALPMATVSPPAPRAPVITGFTVNTGLTVCTWGNRNLSYNFTINYAPYSTGGSFFGEWEYEVPSGTFQVLDLPSFPAMNVPANTVGYSDMNLYGQGLQFHSFEYRARVHATSPSNAYSNWITVQSGLSNC
jgi:hypothetical protein